MGAYLGLPPAELRFAYGPMGQPRLLNSAADVDLRFNLSHSCDLLLVGVARGRSVGVDLELSIEAVVADRAANQQDVAILHQIFLAFLP